MGLVQFFIYSNVFSLVLAPFASVMMAGAYYYSLLKNPKKFISKERDILFSFSYFILIVLMSSALSENRKILLPLNFIFFLILFGFYNHSIEILQKGNARKALRVYVNSSIFPAGIGIIQFIFFNVKPLYGWALKLDTNFLLYKIMQIYSKDFVNTVYHQWVDEGRLYSTLFNPNIFANYLIPVIILSIYFTFHEKSKRKRSFYGILTITNIFLLSQTGSRAGVLGFLTGVFFYIILRYSKRVIFIAVILTAGFLGYLTQNPDIIPRYASMIFDFGDRINIWKAAYAYFIDHPFFGIGIGNFGRRFYAQYETMIIHPHNIYFGLLAEVGILGFMSFFLWIFKIVDYSRRLVKIKNKSMMALWASFVGIFSQGILDYPIYNVQTLLSFLFLLAIITAMTLEENTH